MFFQPPGATKSNLALNGAKIETHACDNAREPKPVRGTDWEPRLLRAMLTIFIHGEVDHLPGTLTQWLDDGGQSVSSTWLLETILGAAAGPKSADAADRVRPADTATKTKGSMMASSSNREQTQKLLAKRQTSFSSVVLQVKMQ